MSSKKREQRKRDEYLQRKAEASAIPSLIVQIRGQKVFVDLKRDSDAKLDAIHAHLGERLVEIRNHLDALTDDHARAKAIEVESILTFQYKVVKLELERRGEGTGREQARRLQYLAKLVRERLGSEVFQKLEAEANEAYEDDQPLLVG